MEFIIAIEQQLAIGSTLMADGTGIEWTDATWNPITGCSLASPGCTNCYAMRLAGTRLQHHWSRRGLTKPGKAGPVWTGEVRYNEEWLDQPLRWQRPRRIFVCAHGDLFHEGVHRNWLDLIFAVMACAPQHQFQVLTKRAHLMRAYRSDPSTPQRIYDLVCDLAINGQAKVVLIAPDMPKGARPPKGRQVLLGQWPLPNVWAGVSIEDQQRADERIPHLRAIPAAVRWVSCEPLLSEVMFDPVELASLDWVVAGGESGPGARPMHPAWARSRRDQCAVAAGVPFLFKQWGEWAPVSEIPDTEEADALLYYPAPRDDPEATRRCKVDQCVLHADGARFDGKAMFRLPAFQAGSGAMSMYAIGKDRAGRTLDGRTHDEFPRVLA